MCTGNVMVSVIMITYNHEQYIQQAIEGVLMQQCDFTYELVIGEDCSTDSTRVICEKFTKQYPGIIRLLPSTRNYGMMSNFIRTLNACSGKYIALCEGDDYWTDPHKLQKQVDLLEMDDTLSGTFHDVYILRSNRLQINKSYLQKYKHHNGIFTAEEVLINWMGHTCSFVFKRSAIDQYDLDQIGIMDFSLAFLVALSGNLKYIPQIMGVYRDHPGGITKIRPNYQFKLDNRQKMYYQLNIASNYRYTDTINYHLLKLEYMYELACMNNLRCLPLIFRYYKLFTRYKFKGERVKNLRKYLAALMCRYYFG